MGETFPNASAQALDLIQQCLQFNPDKRISSIDALKHPYVAEFHNPDDEPDYPHGPIRIVIERLVRLT
jgi:serine/threonine protein kinase